MSHRRVGHAKGSCGYVRALAAENQAAAWGKYAEKLMAESNVVGVIRGRAAAQSEQSRADRKRTCPMRPCRDL
jgi:hypothetical protein